MNQYQPTEYNLTYYNDHLSCHSVQTYSMLYSLLKNSKSRFITQVLQCTKPLANQPPPSQNFCFCRFITKILVILFLLKFFIFLESRKREKLKVEQEVPSSKSLTASQPHSLAASQPPGLTASQPHSLAASQPPSLRALQLHNLAASQPYSLTALQPHSLAALQPCSLVALQPCSLTASQPHSLITLQPHNLAASQPCSLTALQPHSLAASQPRSLTALQPHNLAASQPQNQFKPSLVSTLSAIGVGVMKRCN